MKACRARRVSASRSILTTARLRSWRHDEIAGQLAIGGGILAMRENIVKP